MQRSGNSLRRTFAENGIHFAVQHILRSISRFLRHLNSSGLGYVLACIFELVDILENEKTSYEYNSHTPHVENK